MPTNDKHVVRLPPSPPPVEQDRNDAVTTSRSCTNTFDFDQIPIDNHLILAVCAILFVMGLLFCVFGKRWQKLTMFTPGFICSALLIFFIFEHENYLRRQWAHAAIAVGLGCLFGLVTMQVDYVGLFLIGYKGGLLIGSLVVIVVDQLDDVDTIWLTIGLLFAAGLIGALVTLKFDHMSIILISSIIGGCMVLGSFDWFLQKGVLSQFTWHSLSMKHPQLTSVCLHEWLLAIVWPMITLSAIVLQFRITKTDKSVQSCQRKNDSRLSSQKRELSVSRRVVERRQMSNDANVMPTVTPPCDSPPMENFRRKSFRSLYQQRQKYGDVICQRLVESRRDTSVDSEPPPAYQTTTTITLDLS